MRPLFPINMAIVSIYSSLFPDKCTIPWVVAGRGLCSDSLNTTMPIDASILNEIEHLRELSPPEQAALAEKIDLLRYAADQLVFNYGDPGHALYIVRSGEFEIYVKNDQGEKIVLEISQPGDVFGEVALLDGGSRTAWAAALADAELLRLD